MNRFEPTLRHMTALAGAATLVCFMSGCSSLEEDKINYKSVQKGNSLEIPPDLVQLSRDNRYQLPGNSNSASGFEAGKSTQTATATAPLTVGDVSIERAGNQRWLVVKRAPDKVFPVLRDFWTDNGFLLDTDEQSLGIIETDWAENRAKIPESWIRSALGSIIDQVFDSGERDRFRTRFERVGNKTEIYVSHQHMEETPTADGAAFKWVFAKEDPGLNAAMLARMMVFLGSDIETAREQVANATKDPAGVQVQASDKGDQAELMLNESFDRAWRRVGVAIDSAGFSVEDRDRSAGEFFIRYLDSDTGEKIEQQNIIGRIFGSLCGILSRVSRIFCGLFHFGRIYYIFTKTTNGSIATPFFSLTKSF